MKTYRPCVMFRPTFEMVVDDASRTVTYRDSSNDFEITLRDSAAFKSDARVEGAVKIRPPIPHSELPGYGLESLLVRKSDPPSVLMSGDRRDTTRSSHTTGGGRRSFISVAFERAVLGKPDGLDALRSWAMDQTQRPTVRFPLDGWKYPNAYTGAHFDGWTHDKQDADGWGIFDPAHLESAPLFGGAALGDGLCLAMFCELLRWVTRTFYNANTGKLLQGWHGSRQPRAMGWMPWMLARASMLGLDTCDDAYAREILGVRPKEMLKAVLSDLARKPPRLGENKPDDRTMVDFKDGSGEIRADYPWQWAIYFAAIGWIERSGLMTSSTWRTVLYNAKALAETVIDRSWGVGGVSYAISAHDHFMQADVDKANDLEKDKSHVYELAGPEPDAIRDAPRTSDAELLCGGAALLNVAPDFVTAMLTRLAPPSNMAKYDDLARYMDPAYAISLSATA